MRFVFSAALLALCVAGPAVGQTAPQHTAWSRYAATEVRLRDVAGFVVVTPEDRADIAVSVVNPGPAPALEARINRGRLDLDGQLRGGIRACRVRAGDGFEVDLRRQGRLDAEELPRIHLRVPRHADVTAGGAVRVRIGPSESLRFRIDGCGDADIERVAGDAEVAVAGSPDVRLYEAERATVSVAGAGDVTLGAIRSGLTVSIAGSGDVVAAHADGPTSIAVQGSGDVVIREGAASTLSVAIAGSGDVTHNGAADRLDAAIVGAGDVRVARVSGPVTRRILGSGDVIVGR